MTGNNGKGGDISGASWTVNTNGLGGGGAGDAYGQFCLLLLIVINMISSLTVNFLLIFRQPRRSRRI